MKLRSRAMDDAACHDHGLSRNDIRLSEDVSRHCTTSSMAVPPGLRQRIEGALNEFSYAYLRSGGANGYLLQVSFITGGASNQTLPPCRAPSIYVALRGGSLTVGAYWDIRRSGCLTETIKAKMIILPPRYCAMGSGNSHCFELAMLTSVIRNRTRRLYWLGVRTG